MFVSKKDERPVLSAHERIRVTRMMLQSMSMSEVVTVIEQVALDKLDDVTMTILSNKLGRMAWNKARTNCR